MQVVITGGTGLIGRALVGSLLADHRPLVLSRNPAAISDLPAGVDLEGWDGSDPEVLAGWIDGADAVVHLAGENIAQGRWTGAKKKRILDSRVDSTRAVSIAFERAIRPPGVLIQGSAVGVYGDRGDEELTEDSALGSGFLAEVCHRWEAASEAVADLPVRRVVLRTGVVLSRQGGALPQLLLPFRLFVGGPVGSGRQWFPWIHIADEVAAIRFLLEGGLEGPVNLVAPESMDNRDFGRVVGHRLGRPSFFPTPAPMLKLALGEKASIVLDSQKVVPRRLLEAGFTFSYPTVDRALANLLG